MAEADPQSFDAMSSPHPPSSTANAASSRAPGIQNSRHVASKRIDDTDTLKGCQKAKSPKHLLDFPTKILEQILQDVVETPGQWRRNDLILPPGILPLNELPKVERYLYAAFAAPHHVLDIITKVINSKAKFALRITHQSVKWGGRSMWQVFDQRWEHTTGAHQKKLTQLHIIVDFQDSVGYKEAEAAQGKCLYDEVLKTFRLIPARFPSLRSLDAYVCAGETRVEQALLPAGLLQMLDEFMDLPIKTKTCTVRSHYDAGPYGNQTWTETSDGTPTMYGKLIEYFRGCMDTNDGVFSLR